MCTFGLSGCGVKPRRLRGRRFHTTTENSKRAHLTAPALPNTNTTKTTRRHIVREKKSETGGGRRKKSAKIWAPPHPSGPHHSGPHPSGLGLGPTLWAITHQIQKWMGQNWIGQNWIWPKLDVAKIGQIRMAKTGLAKVGPFRCRPVSQPYPPSQFEHVWSGHPRCGHSSSCPREDLGCAARRD